MEKSFTTKSKNEQTQLINGAKQIVNTKPKDNKLLIELAWNKKLVLPYEDGLAILKALKNAELMIDEYGKDPMVVPIAKEDFRSTTMAHQSYEDIKVAALLHITLQELHDSRAEELPF